MPQIERFIEDINITNNRPVIKSVVREMCEAVGISPKINIFYPDGKTVVEQPGSTITESDNTASFNTKEHLLITVKDTPGFGALYYDTRHLSETKPIFSDPAIGLFIHPIITNREFEISVKYVAPDKVSGDAWLEYIRSHILNNQLRLLHRARGSFLIPKDAVEIIEHVHELRENVAPYGESLEKYFWDHADSRFTVFTDQGGKNKALGFVISYSEFYGYFELSTEPEKPQADEKNETSVVEFIYKFQIDVPTSLLIKYPVIIHNQYIKKEYILDVPATPYNELNPHGTDGVIIGNYFAYKGPLIPDIFRIGIRAPKHDTWLASGETYPKHTLPIFTVLTMIDENNKKLLMNMKDVPDLYLPELVLNFILKESRWILRDTESLFQLTLYEMDAPIIENDVVLGDKTLDIGLIYDANLRKYYHVRLGIYLDLRYLSDRALESLKENGKVIDWWINTYHPDWLNGRGDWPPGWAWSEDKIRTINTGDGKEEDYIDDYTFSLLTDKDNTAPQTVQTLRLGLR